MEKIFYRKSFGFSLAEALITLLIVCLITLASIPVLTKKKRNITQGATGQYICTKIPLYNNDKITGYKYVYYDSRTSEGDINDPSTWEVSGDGSSCKFVPPLNAKNFGVTLIGGGGAGGKGISKFTPVLDYNNSTYKNTKTGKYRINMVGGGAGGAGGSHQSPNGAGSGGGAGGYLSGDISLPANYTYGFQIGEGSKEYGAFSASQSSEPRAENGGDTIFYYLSPSGKENIFIAHGGTGGQTRTCKNRPVLGIPNWKCGGGNPSPGGNIEILKNLNFSNGYSGQGGTGTSNVTTNNYTTAGSGILIDGAYYGAGGRGRKDCRSAGCAENGQRGTFSLNRYDIFGGLGGNAAVPLVIPMPKIEGYLQIEVGDGGDPTLSNDELKNGRPTIVKVYNSYSKFLRQYIAEGGNVGGSNTDSQSTAGANSLWNNTGAGAPATCTEGKDAYVTKEKQELVTETDRCYLAIGTMNYNPNSWIRRVDLSHNPGWMGYRTCNLHSATLEGYVSARGLKAENYGFTPVGIYVPGYNICQTTYGCSSKAAMDDLGLDEEPVHTMCFDNPNQLIDLLNMDPDAPDFAEAFYNRYGTIGNFQTYWSHTDPVKYECMGNEKKKIVVETPVFHPAQPASCKKGGDAKYFGAGGGGGGAGKTIGTVSEGGRGAPGAVIVQW